MSEVQLTKNVRNGITISENVTSKVFAQLTEEEQMLETRAREGSEEEKDLLNFLAEYKSVMNTTEELGDVGNNMQQRLYRKYVQLIDKTPNTEFRKIWALLLLWANVERKGVFHPDMINRFSHLWTIGEEKLFGFQMVNNIIMITANPVTRARYVKFQIDFSKSLDKYFTQEGAQKVISFYKS